MLLLWYAFHIFNLINAKTHTVNIIIFMDQICCLLFIARFTSYSCLIIQLLEGYYLPYSLDKVYIYLFICPSV